MNKNNTVKDARGAIDRGEKHNGWIESEKGVRS